MELKFFMLLSARILKRLIICTNKITNREIRECYKLFHEISLDIVTCYVSLTKVYLLIARMYILDLDISSILDRYGLKHPLSFLNLEYEQCDDLELEYIMVFYNLVILNAKRMNVMRILAHVFRSNRDKYNDIVVLRKAREERYLTSSEISRLSYLVSVFREYRINYVVSEKTYVKIFNKVPNTEEVYQDVDQSCNTKYLPWRDYRNGKL